MADMVTREEQAAIAAYRGAVTVCPPRTFSVDAAEMVPWKRQMSGWTKVNAAKREQYLARAAERREQAQMQRQQQTLELVQKMRDLAAEGLTIVAIAARVGLSEDWIRRLARRHGVDLRTVKDEMILARVERLRKMGAEGMTHKQAADKEGITRQAVRYLVRAYSIKFLTPQDRLTAAKNNRG